MSNFSSNINAWVSLLMRLFAVTFFHFLRNGENLIFHQDDMLFKFDPFVWPKIFLSPKLNLYEETEEQCSYFMKTMLPCSCQ